MLNENSYPLRPVTLTVAAVHGMILDVDGKPCEVPWGAVHGISAGRVLMANDVWHLALAADIEIISDVRLAIVTEADRIWTPFTQILPKIFPQVPRVTVWGPQALTTPAPLSLYDRASDAGEPFGAGRRLQ